MICAIFKYNIVDIIDHDPIVATMVYIQTSKHDQEIPESHTIDRPLVPRQNECVLIILLFTIQKGMRGSRKFCQRNPTLTTFFLVDEGREDPSATLSGPSSARQRNAIKWRFAGVSMMAQH